MLPYLLQPVFSLGPFRIHAFALFAVAAILVARWIVLRRGRRFGFTYEDIAPLYLTVLLTGLAGALIAGIFDVVGHGISSAGAIVGGAAGAIGLCVARRYSLLQAMSLLDIAAFASPFAGAIGRLGCTIAHEHRGLPSDGWLAFQFPEGSRYDLGFIDALFLIALSIAFVVLDRKPRTSLFLLRCRGEQLWSLPSLANYTGAVS